MGYIVGAALVSHVPTIVLPEAVRRRLNDGSDISLHSGLHRLAEEKLRPLQADTVIVVDSHWFTTIEHVVTSHDCRIGTFTSGELPRGMRQVPYDIPGDPELAISIAAQAQNRDDTWITACDDPHLPIQYATVNLLPFLQGEEAWLSVSVCQTATVEDFLLFGELIGQAIAETDRRVVVLASGGLSHRFWPLRELRHHEASDPSKHLVSDDARRADEQVLAWMRSGDHSAILDFVSEYQRHAPEGSFGHFLTMIGALGGAACVARGTQFGAYEAAAGTGQAHVWFDLS